MRPLHTVALSALLLPTVAAAQGKTTPAGRPFNRPRLLLLRSTMLPSGYSYLGYRTFRRLSTWDSNERGAIATDRRYGWTRAAQELFLDTFHYYGGVSVALFLTPTSAGRDMDALYTPQHPFTRFVRGQTWKSGRTVRVLGVRAELYSIRHPSTQCPNHTVTGLALVLQNAVFNVEMCTVSAGTASVLEIGTRLVDRARWVLAHPNARVPHPGPPVP